MYTYPIIADTALSEGWDEFWVSPQEAASTIPGDFPHGVIEDLGPQERVWNDYAGVWFRVER